MKIISRALLAIMMVGSLIIAALPATAASTGTYVIVNKGAPITATTTYTGTATSFNQRTDNFSVGYWVYNGKLVPANSLLTTSNAPVSNLNLDLSAYGPGFNPVIAKGTGTDLNLTGSLSAYDTSNGKDGNDFTGLGTQIIASNGAKVNVNGMNIYTKGFVHDAFIADNGGQLTVRNSKVTTMGANPLTQAYQGYENSAIQSEMLSPPWQLGIQGGVRASNELGTSPTLSVINSQVNSGGWALLSTDSGSNEKLNVVDSTLTMLPKSRGGMWAGPYAYANRFGSGYGSYLIGGALEDFYGVREKGVTYGAILTGGTANYASSNGPITLTNYDGSTKIATVQGQGNSSVIDSVWGFMSHGDGTVNLLNGTVVNSQLASFLYKGGNVTFNADGAILHSKSGVLLQMIPNPDGIVTTTMANGGPCFGPLEEYAGWPSDNVGQTLLTGSAGPGAPATAINAVTTTALNGHVLQQGPPGTPASYGPNYDTVNLDLANGNYNGNVYNGTGYYNEVADVLNVNMKAGASLKGAMQLTETKYIDQNGTQNALIDPDNSQLIKITDNQYYYLGHVVNKPFNNGNSQINVNLTNGAKWIVTGPSEITSLSVGNGTITGAKGCSVQMTVNGTPTTIQQNTTYTGDIVITLVKS